jgi:Ca-activated chloride channel family protein
VDGGALQLLVDGLDPDMASTGGTGLSRALKQGTELLLGEADVADRVLVVFTDGEPTTDSLPDILTQAERVHRSGVRLILVGEGGREPAPIPQRAPDGQLLGEQRDENGERVRTWRRDAVLTSIADAAQGVVVSADLRDQAGAVRELVLAYKRAPQATALTSSGVPRAWIPLLAGVVLLLGHALTRRTAALAVLLLACAWPRQAPAQGIAHPGDRRWRAGDLRGAAERYLADVKAGIGGDTAWLAAGTAGLALGDTALARAALSHAAESVDPEVRFRAVYNLGLMHLRQASSDSAGRDRLLAEARRRYREALLLKPGDSAAKWNLELTIKRSPPSGGGGSDAPSPSANAPSAANAPPRPQSLTAALAEQILNSIAEDERKTRQEMNRRMAQSRQGSAGERDW